MVDAMPVNVVNRTEQQVRTSNQQVEHSFTTQDDLNIIRKFCAVGWCQDVRVVELPSCGFQTRGLLPSSACSKAGQTDS